MAEGKLQKTSSPFTVMVFAVRKPGTTFEQFKSYYENNHVPLITRVLKGGQYYQSYTRHYIDRSAEGAFPFGKEECIGFDCVARSEYASKQDFESMIEAFKDNLEEIEADEKLFLDQSKTVIVVPGETPSERVMA